MLWNHQAQEAYINILWQEATEFLNYECEET